MLNLGVLFTLTVLASSALARLTADERQALRTRRRSRTFARRAGPSSSANPGQAVVTSRSIVCPAPAAGAGSLSTAIINYNSANGYLQCSYSGGITCGYDTNGNYQAAGSSGSATACGSSAAQATGTDTFTRCPTTLGGSSTGTPLDTTDSFLSLNGPTNSNLSPQLACFYTANGDTTRCNYDLSGGGVFGGMIEGVGGNSVLSNSAQAIAAGCSASSIAGSSSEAVTPY